MPYLKKSLFLFLITCLFCGCSQKDFGTKHAHYELGASLSVPENWQRVDLIAVAAVSSMAFEDGEGGFIILTQNFETSFRKQMRIISEMNYPILEKGPLLFSKYKTQWFQSVDNRTTNIAYVLKANEGRIFSILCAAPSINFVSYRANFDRAARSFRAFWSNIPPRLKSIRINYQSFYRPASCYRM